LSIRRSSCPLGSHAWILIAMFHLAMDLASCQPPASGPGGRLSPRPALRHRLSRSSPWGTGSAEELWPPGPPWTCAPAPLPQRPRSRRPPPAALLPTGRPPRRLRSRRGRRHLRGHGFAPRDGRPTAMPEVILLQDCREGCGRAATVRSPPRPRSRTRVLRGAGRVCSSRARSPAAASRRRTPPELELVGRGWVPGPPHPPLSLALALASPGLLFVPAAACASVLPRSLVTACLNQFNCAQSGRPRRNSHQRKLDQQEESCQNLTDFAPARVPSALDIFTAYNETLQCSHECVRTPVPVYAEEVLHSPGDYKTTFNGNRSSSSDRHLIPVAFVSEKWFEISC
ncbi:AJAP1 protein, partial [Ardeotis kori]|nr:AJAP1 protein [Ardeotis kori]